jgi:hypothetical protein
MVRLSYKLFLGTSIFFFRVSQTQTTKGGSERLESEEGQLEQIPDSAEDTDVEDHRKNRFEPAFKAFPGQGRCSAGDIHKHCYCNPFRPACKQASAEPVTAFDAMSRQSVRTSSALRALPANDSKTDTASAGCLPFW